MLEGFWIGTDGVQQDPAKSILIDAPPGSGKTVVALAIAQYGADQGKRIGWVAMRRNLLRQATEMRDSFGFRIPNMKLISMFDRNPPRDVDWIIADECLPYGTYVDVLVDGKPTKVKIGDIVCQGIGTHALSRSNNGTMRYKSIISRTPTGYRKILDVIVQHGTNRINLQITPNGRIWTARGYLRADQLCPGDKVLITKSWYSRLVERILWSDRIYSHGQTGESTIYRVSSTSCRSASSDSLPTCDRISPLQDRKIPSSHVVEGNVESITDFGIEMATFDIGVADNHNFFADGILVHNCHHDSTDSMARIHEAIKPEKVIGLSATPFRSDRMKLAFERTVKDAGINSLIQEGWLSKYDHYTIPIFSPDAITNLFRSNPDQWGKSIVFFRTMAECTKTNELLRQAGMKSDIVWGGSDRESQIDALRSGELQILVSMSILAEGFDMEDLRTVFVRPSSRLPTVQMCGRVLRLYPGLDAKQIVQCKDTRYPFIRTASSRMSYIQIGEEFRSLSTSANVEETARWYAKEILRVQVNIPDFIRKRKEKQSRPRRRRQRQR